MDKHRYPALQILRGIAASAVVANHVWHSPENGVGLRDILRIGDLAHLGVMAFFCLSGMLMVLTTRQATPGARPAALFLRARVERIYPVYVLWLSILLAMIVAAAAAGSGFLRHLWVRVWPDAVIRNYLLLPGLPGERNGMFIGQAWTLVYEMYFYVVFAACLLFFNGTRLLVALCVVIGVPVLAAWVTGFHAERLSWVNIDYIVTDPLVLNFIMGGIFGAWLKGHSRHSADLPLAGRPMPQWLFVAAALAISLAPMPFLPSFVHNLGSVALLIAMTFLVVRPNRITRALVYLGDASYSIYVSHIVFSVSAWQVERRLPLPTDAVGVLLTAMAIVVGCLSYSLFERQVTDRLKAARRTRRTEPQAVSP
jgi:peptidoglycan/LPS O-acetylase OafA/YrhL